jgi:hypothetical protein
MLYGTFLVTLIPDFCLQSFAVRHYFRINFRFAVWLQYQYVIVSHKFATLEQCFIAKDGWQKSGRSFARKVPYSVIRGEVSIIVPHISIFMCLGRSREDYELDTTNNFSICT